MIQLYLTYYILHIAIHDNKTLKCFTVEEEEDPAQCSIVAELSIILPILYHQEV